MDNKNRGPADSKPEQYIDFSALSQAVYDQMPRRSFTIVESGRKRQLWGHQDYLRRCVNCMHDHTHRADPSVFAVAQVPYYLCRAQQVQPCQECECVAEVVPIPEDQIDQAK